MLFLFLLLPVGLLLTLRGLERYERMLDGGTETARAEARQSTIAETPHPAPAPAPVYVPAVAGVALPATLVEPLTEAV